MFNNFSFFRSLGNGLATAVSMPRARLRGVRSTFGRAEPSKKLKVFILAGQSNMEGHARVETFDSIGDDPATAPLLKMMCGADGKPAVCEGVWISYLTGYSDGSANGEGLGKLTAGFGARGEQPTEDGGKIGPEFTFGLTMDAAFAEPGLIIKTAWGGRSLNTEFRPPSAGPYELNEFQKKLYDGPPGHGVPEDMNAWSRRRNRRPDGLINTASGWGT